MPTTSSMRVAATCRCRTASRARRSAASTNRVTTRSSMPPVTDKIAASGTSRRSRPPWCAARRDHPVTMQVIVPGATSVNPASRTATAARFDRAAQLRPRARARVPHGERGHRGQPVRRRVQHRRVPHLRGRLADRHLQRRVDVDHRDAGERRPGVVRLEVGAADLQPRDDLGHVVPGVPVIHVNAALEMTVGKAAAEVGHASMLYAAAHGLAAVPAFAVRDAGPGAVAAAVPRGRSGGGRAAAATPGSPKSRRARSPASSPGDRVERHTTAVATGVRCRSRRSCR